MAGLWLWEITFPVSILYVLDIRIALYSLTYGFRTHLMGYQPTHEMVVSHHEMSGLIPHKMGAKCINLIATETTWLNLSP